jgi:hypothetical protein
MFFDNFLFFFLFFFCFYFSVFFLENLNFGGKSLKRLDLGKEKSCFDFEVLSGELQIEKQFETVTLIQLLVFFNKFLIE